VIRVVAPKGDPLNGYGDRKNSPGFVAGGRIETGKDGYTVKKLIALLLVAVFVSTGIVGCGGTETKATPKTGTGTGTGGGTGGGTTPPGK
jgi:hypothetical protein